MECQSGRHNMSFLPMNHEKVHFCMRSKPQCLVVKKIQLYKQLTKAFGASKQEQWAPQYHVNLTQHLQGILIRTLIILLVSRAH